MYRYLDTDKLAALRAAGEIKWYTIDMRILMDWTYPSHSNSAKWHRTWNTRQRSSCAPWSWHTARWWTSGDHSWVSVQRRIPLRAPATMVEHFISTPLSNQIHWSKHIGIHMFQGLCTHRLLIAGDLRWGCNGGLNLVMAGLSEENLVDAIISLVRDQPAGWLTHQAEGKSARLGGLMNINGIGSTH